MLQFLHGKSTTRIIQEASLRAHRRDPTSVIVTARGLGLGAAIAHAVREAASPRLCSTSTVGERLRRDAWSVRHPRDGGGESTRRARARGLARRQ